MTEKQKALDYVREKCPELKELSFGCIIDWGLVGSGIKGSTTSKRPYAWFDHADDEDVLTPDKLKKNPYVKEIIGHQPQLQHWLRVLSLKEILNIDGLSMSASNFVVTTDGIAINDNGMHLMKFDLTTGQPATEEDYQKFNEIVGI